MIIVYDSLTGLGKKFAEKLGYPTRRIEEYINEPCILVTRNIGLGKITDTTSLFLDTYQDYVVGVVVNGNKKFGPFYCKAADKINKHYNIPIIKKISGEGTSNDVVFVKDYINTMTNKL